MGTFPARYSSHCNGCDEWIEEGDLIGYVEDTVVRSECYEEAEEANRPYQPEPFRFDGLAGQ